MRANRDATPPKPAKSNSPDGEEPTAVDEALLEYHREVEAGCPPAQTDFIARHPHLATELTAYYAAEAELCRRLDSISGAEPSWVQPEPFKEPRPFGKKYELLGELGRSLGVVYRAADRSLGRIVALKVMASGAHASNEERTRFVEEAQKAAELEHPNIVPIYDVGEVDGVPYFTMRLFEAKTLREALPRLRGDVRAAAILVEKVARAVHYAHSRGILHRDLKPANILLGPGGEPCVADFGLAKRLGGDSSLTATGAALGTPHYMAPEQALGDKKALSWSTDVWGLGVVLYELLTGRLPFAGESPVEIMKRVVEVEPPAPSRIDRRVPRDLETITLACLEKRPRQRYPDAAAVADDLRRWIDGLPIIARPTTRIERAGKLMRRRPLHTALGVVVVVSAVTIALIAWWASRATRPWEEISRLESYAQKVQQAAAALQAENTKDARMQLADSAPGTRLGDEVDFGWRWLRGQLPEPVATVEAESAPLYALTLPDGKTLAYYQSGLGPLVLFDTTTHRILRRIADTRERPEDRDRTRRFAVSRHGAWILSDNEEIFPFDLKTGRAGEPFQQEPPQSRIFALAFHPAGEIFAAGHLENGVRLFDFKTRKQTAQLDAGSGAVHIVAFSPDGSVLAAGGEDKSFRLWREPEWRPARARLRVDEQLACWSLTFSPAGDLLASGHIDGRVTLWDLATLTPRWSEKGPGGEGNSTVTSLAFSPDNRLLATGRSDKGRRVPVRFVHNGRLVVRTPEMFGSTWSVAFTSDCRTLITGTEGLKNHTGEVHRWDATQFEPHELEADLAAPSSIVWWLGFLDGGKTIVATDNDFGLHAFDLESGRTGGVLREKSSISSLKSLKWGSQAREVLSPDGVRFAFGLKDGNVEMSRLDWVKGEATPEQTLEGTGHIVQGSGFAPSGRLFARVSKRGHAGKVHEVAVWKLQSGAGAQTPWMRTPGFEVPCEVQDMAFSRDERYVAMNGWRDPEGFVVLGDLEQHRAYPPVPVPEGKPFCVAVSPDQSLVAAGGSSRIIYLWRIDSRAEGGLRRVKELHGHTDKVTFLAFVPDKRRIFSTSDDGTVRLWGWAEGPSGEIEAFEILRIPGFRGQTKVVALSPDGSTLIVGGGKERECGELRAYFAPRAAAGTRP